jgi:hypothetical protein
MGRTSLGDTLLNEMPYGRDFLGRPRNFSNETESNGKSRWLHQSMRRPGLEAADSNLKQGIDADFHRAQDFSSLSPPKKFSRQLWNSVFHIGPCSI